MLKTLFYNPIRKKYSLNSALLAVYLSSALWHGVSANFLLWGFFHALCFMISVKFLKKDLKLLALILMVPAIVIGRVIFADTDFDRLILILSFSSNSPSELILLLKGVPTISLISILFASIWVSLEFLLQDARFFKERSYKFLRIPIIQVFLMILFVLLAGSNTGVEYAVYNQR